MTRYAVMLDESGSGDRRRRRGAAVRAAVLLHHHDHRRRQLFIGSCVRLNTMWGMQVGIVNVTGAYAAMNLAGPQSRAVLSKVTTMDLSRAAFPYLGVREDDVAGVPVRVLRVGFVGELGYEIHTPAECGAHLWDALMEAGQAFGIGPFGVEAQRLLRLEKGHIIIGQDTDGLTVPYDAALEWTLRMDKPFFVGQRSLRIIEKHTRKHKLAGFVLDQRFSGEPPKECHLVIRNGDMAGRVTSIAFSESLGCYVGLAFVAPEMAQEGARFTIRADAGHMVEAQVVKTPFYDPAAERQT